MSTFLRLNFPRLFPRAFYGELQFPTHCPFPRLLAFFLGNLKSQEQVALDCQNRISLEACIKESRKHLVHTHVCTHTHTHDSLLSYTAGKNTSIIQRHLWVHLRGRQKEGKGSHRAADFSHLTPPPSTFSTSSLLIICFSSECN